VDLDNGLADVRQQYVHTRRGPILKRPKTDKSFRVVPLSAPVVSALRAHLEAMKAEGWYGPDQPVFVTRVGTRMQPRNFLRRFKSLLKQAGIDSDAAHIHTLRHTFVSLLLEQGEELVTVKELVGHARLAHTSDLYAHLSDRFKRRAVDKLGALLESSKRVKAGKPEGDNQAPGGKPGTKRAPNA